MITIRFQKWQEFRDYLDYNKLALPVYWRGQLDPTWPLASSFERKILAMHGGSKAGASHLYPYDNRYANSEIRDVGFYQGLQGVRDGYLQSFKKAASGLRGPNPKDLSEEEWWALGRHHGLITPLLDWTEKPYIAAFFALTELYTKIKIEGGSLYSAGKEVAIYRLIHNRELEGNGLSIIKVVVDELGRLQGQRGLFTWLNSEKYFELQGFLDNTDKGDLLTQIILSDQCLVDGLSDFSAYGIDYRLLFPDLTGAAMSANIMWDIL